MARALDGLCAGLALRLWLGLHDLLYVGLGSHLLCEEWASSFWSWCLVSLDLEGSMRAWMGCFIWVVLDSI